MKGMIRSTYDYLAEERDAAKAGKKHTPEQVARLLETAMEEIRECDDERHLLRDQNHDMRKDAEAFRSLRSALSEGGAS